MNKQSLLIRTKNFSLRIIALAEEMLKKKGVSRILADQILRSGTAVGANYRAACIAKSTKDFLNKLKICEEEADETVFWLDMLIESGTIRAELLYNLRDEASQLTAILTASIKTKKLHMKKKDNFSEKASH